MIPAIVLTAVILLFLIIVYLAPKNKAKHTDLPKVESENSIDDTNIGYMTFRVAGVTFQNDDGTSRQEIISKLRQKHTSGESMQANLKEFSYNNKPALAVFIDGKQVGNVPLLIG